LIKNYAQSKDDALEKIWALNNSVSKAKIQINIEGEILKIMIDSQPVTKV
jgi:hypothetical protein